jgi:hypothetical protein
MYVNHLSWACDGAAPCLFAGLLDRMLQFKGVMTAPDDKRLHPRLPKRVKLRYRLGDEKWRSAFTQDVSTFGLYIHTMAIPTTTSIEVEIADENHNNEIIRLRGQVVRGKKVPPRLRRMFKSGFAVRLVDVPNEWYRYCLDIEEKARERGQRFLQVTTDVVPQG